jgi:hypothetical protein
MNVNSEFLIQMITTVGLIPALFIWLLLDTRKEHKEERKNTKEREDSLFEHINKSDEIQRQIMKSIEQINASQEKIQTSVCMLQKDVEDMKRSNC